MNIVLFDRAETQHALPRHDERARHICRVLKREVGDSFDVGLINGPRGKAKLTAIDADELTLEFTWSAPHPRPAPTILGVGFPRPQTARDILRDATTLGATALHFVATRRSDPNYAASSLWQSGEWQRHATNGAAQAFDTFVPTVSWHQDLAGCIADPAFAGVKRLALDVYGAAAPLAKLSLPTPDQPVLALIGPERGWDDADRALFTANDIPRFHLGERVLRTETAVTATMALINAARLRA
ncbi:16S rRNA (uracil(1498)-N(3))-methyltransferase [Synoicihabitans lomoniglobus]|uniref:Ribosomal RNA small subunit methyltransferase E n=1 Tax=Synoicihabitans lomoniglobus TaxID=2909285 RepID=A0AAE9ZVH8_9BACT|nr:16S rRNA (uracil(1498)-N(3))-methyltransferase [Opitutaceae bacterium LMO-M01]WED63894.1 RsmE family RNA methyltransferase [Opitutaceae bacterium LMO-M01]